MKIVVDPKWTFIEALQAAWKAYSGGVEFGAPNRIRVLEQWANIVGREQAIAELEATISDFETIELASRGLCLSKYAIRKLRKSFKAMPVLTPASAEPQDIYELLKLLPTIDFPNEMSLIVYAIPRLATLLGYAKSELHFEPALAGNPRLRPDALLVLQGTYQPHMVIETKLLKQYSLDDWEYAKARLTEYISSSNAELGIVLSPNRLLVQYNGESLSYDLRALTRTQAESLQKILYRKPSTSTVKSERKTDANQHLAELLSAVGLAKTNNDKKNSLERLAVEVFEIHSFLRCKFKNLRTASSEIDLVCEYLGNISSNFLDEYGRYFLVECKNWAKPAGAKEIRDFLGKLRKTRTRLGIFFSKSGITGAAKGTDALRELHSAYDQDGTSIIILANSDLRSVTKLSDVLDLIDGKLDALRFDL
jgi:hypothetical protein